MGKKSKKKAGNPPSQNAAAGGGKNVRCIFCSGTVKVSEGKGHTCPGCSEICCHRCEKKQFKECPNGTGCVNPCRRCIRCASGATVNFALAAHGAKQLSSQELDNMLRRGLTADEIRIFQDVAATDERYTSAAIPFAFCHLKKNHGREDKVMECYECLSSPTTTFLSQCAKCDLTVCEECRDADIDFHADQLIESGERVGNDLFTHAMLNSFVEQVRCTDCETPFCICCLDEEAREKIPHNFANSLALFRCDSCYYAKKPCTNPTCPNPVGVPTKRCGGCHISRYCSKECQAAAYPEHKAKCERMQEKLAAKSEEIEVRTVEGGNWVSRFFSAIGLEN